MSLGTLVLGSNYPLAGEGEEVPPEVPSDGVRGYNEMILISSTLTLTAGVIYALPARRVLVRVQQTGGTIECSNDGTTFEAVTLDDDEQFETAARFIRAVTTNAIVSCAA